MPGGSRAGWERARPLLEAIAARHASVPCAAYIGQGGAGHYVKMVHNGIEYADMQLIAEIYDLLKRGLDLSAAEMARVFAEWNEHELKSYLVEITARILQRADPDTGGALVDVILDEAAQKGTGRWASQNAFDLGTPIPTINAAVESRLLSSLKAERVAACQRLDVARAPFNGDREQVVRSAGAALYAGKIISYAQGFGMLRAASIAYKYDLNLSEIATIWRAGCIIRAGLLADVAAACARKPEPASLVLDDFFRAEVLARQAALRETLQVAISLGIPMLALSSALAYFDAYRSQVLPANLTQAQRDYFGAHTYRRVDRAGDFHTDWENQDAD
jgi:6-phosphogluconate dehydrogenase